MHRRTLLKSAALMSAWATLPAQATRLAGDARLLIVVYLKGGNDGYSSVVPYSNPLYKAVRPTLAIAREQVIPINETHGFNAALAPLADIWQRQELAIVQGIGFPSPEQQHDPDVSTLFTAGPDIAADGWLTRALQGSRDSRKSALLDALAIGDLDVRILDPMGPFRGRKLRVAQLQHPSEWLDGRALGDCTIDTTRGTATPAFRARRLPAIEALQSVTFPTSPFGEAAHLAVRFAAMERTVPVIHITVNAVDGDHHHAFDTHERQAEFNTPALEQLSQGLAALRAGLIAIGRWDDTMIMTVDEFGRSPMENEKQGTHHGSANTQFVMGGRVRPGLYGEAPAVARNFSIGGVPPVIDYRALFTTAIEGWLGLPAANVFDRHYRALDVIRA
jgi:uncharacterized protein (DUF1501 family)